jgi:UDP-galactopyranose mutase
MSKKILIVGCGFSGATFGRMAAEAGHEVTIIDRRDHIGGNAYTYRDEETGIDVHKYGAHIFHTNDDKVWAFVNRFSKFNNYTNRVKAITGGHIYTLPVNLHTINQFFGKTFTPKEAEAFIESLRVPVAQVTNFEEFVISSIGEELYEAFYKYYSIKQWGVHPTEIIASTAKRLPIRFYYDDNYFGDKYQGIPIDGYTSLFERMLAHPNIKVILKTEYTDVKDSWRKRYDNMVFTGPIDYYFDHCYGKLPYRTLRFEEIRDKEIQGNAVVNYTDMSQPFTRVIEHKYFAPGKKYEHSVGFKEFSEAADSSHDPYYPVRNGQSDKIFSQYDKLAATERDVLFLGRLAEFKYYDMHQVIGAALAAFRRWAGKETNATTAPAAIAA